MKIILNKFKCNNCEKESNLFEEKPKFHAGYPYDDGWIYLYCFEFKDKKDKVHNTKDKHFCSGKCMKEFIIKEIEEEIK